MFNPFHQETLTERAARAWADMATWTEQFVERQPVVTPELTEALQEAIAKAKQFKAQVEQESNTNGNE